MASSIQSMGNRTLVEAIGKLETLTDDRGYLPDGIDSYYQLLKSEHTRRVSEVRNSIWDYRMKLQYLENDARILAGREPIEVTGRSGNVDEEE